MMKRELRNFDFIVVLCVGIVFFIGLFFLYSAAKSLSPGLSRLLVTRQLIWMLMGLTFAIIFFSIDYRKLIDVSYFLYVGNILLLVLVLFLGTERLGAQRWITIAGFGFQPSEFIKISFILMVASFLGRRKQVITNINNLFIPLLFLVLPFILIAKQPDLGTALVLVPIFLSMLFISGMDIKGIVLFVAGGILATPLFWHFLKSYQKKRLLVFVNPDLDPLGAGYTIIQSKIAVGSGELFGKGWLSGTQSQLNFLPERHTDFIFSVVGEEWGFIGGGILIMLYFLVIYRGIKIIEKTNDIYGKLIATGIVSLLAFQVVVNIGMTLGLLPVVGLTLPFISYGGSSLISSIIAVAILLNIGMRRPLF